MYTMVTIINNAVLYIWNFLREYITGVLTTNTKSQASEVTDVLNSSIVVTVSKCLHLTLYTLNTVVPTYLYEGVVVQNSKLCAIPNSVMDSLTWHGSHLFAQHVHARWLPLSHRVIFGYLTVVVSHISLSNPVLFNNSPKCKSSDAGNLNMPEKP